MAVSIEPTTACNLRCPECPSGLRSFTRPTGRIERNIYEKIINQLSQTTTYLTLYFQGEPYLNPSLMQMINYASLRNMYVTTSTNGHFLSEEMVQKTIESGLNRLIISIDGLDQETYESYRKEGSLQEVIAGTERMIKKKRELRSSTPMIIWQFLVVRPNEHQVNDVKSLAKAMGVDKVAFKTAQVYDFECGNDLIPTNEKYSRYRQDHDGRFYLKNKIENHCWRMWSSAVITWDGQVLACCFDKDADHPMGNLDLQSFKDIWNSHSYADFRKQLLTDRSQVEMCKNCTEGTKVWA